MASFDELLSETVLLKNLMALGYSNSTAVQESSIPLILEGRDLLSVAPTGTGKTAAFCLPILQKLLSVAPQSRNPRALILAPTRELCSQINSTLECLGQGTMIRSCAVYGGVPSGPQVAKLGEGVSVVVATPGRLLDLLEKRHLRFRELEVLVLDEADRMLDLGFCDDIISIVKCLPTERQTLLFSATMPAEIEALTSRILKTPRLLRASDGASTAPEIDQKVYLCKGPHKFQLLKALIKTEIPGLVIVFTRKKTTADSVVDYLTQNRIAARAIHGEKDQENREKSLAQFSRGSMRVLVATDIVSRGIDVDGVEGIINFDLPLDPESYVHRIGRTARAGRSGRAFSFCTEEEERLLPALEAFLGKKLPREKFQGKSEMLKLRPKKVTPPTPGRSQEKPAWFDHSKRQRVREDGKKINLNPAFKKKKNKR